MRLLPLVPHKVLSAESLTDLLRSALEDHLKATELKSSALPFPGAGSQFFLKTETGVVWAMVYRDALPSHPLPDLQRRVDSVARTLKEKILFLLLFPSVSPEAAAGHYHLNQESEELSPAGKGPLFLEYILVRKGGSEIGVCFRQWLSRRSPPPYGKRPQPALTDWRPAPDGRFDLYEHARLGKEELSELLNLSLHLRRFAPNPS